MPPILLSREQIDQREISGLEQLPAGAERLFEARHRLPQAGYLVATELTTEDAAPVLKGALEHYLATPMRPFLERYYAPSGEGSIEDFIEVARHHPVFRLREVATP